MGKEVPFDIDIDRYLNRVIPRSRLYLLPKPISWWLGHREKQRPRIGSVLVWWWACVGAFAGILTVEAVYMSVGIKSDGAPIVIGSLGATAILEYNVIDSPLSQPRNAFFGQLFASIIGVGITKLFHFHPGFEHLRWVAGALAVSVTSAFMGFTKTVHPPAGATALLAATSPEISDIGWYLVPLITVGCVLMLAVACVINNIQRTFPMYWWTPVDLSHGKTTDIERRGGGDDEKKHDKGEESDGGLTYEHYRKDENHLIVIDGSKISVPDWIELDAEESRMLEIIRERLAEGLSSTTSESTDDTHVQHWGNESRQ